MKVCHYRSMPWGTFHARWICSFLKSLRPIDEMSINESVVMLPLRLRGLKCFLIFLLVSHNTFSQESIFDNVLPEDPVDLLNQYDSCRSDICKQRIAHKLTYSGKYEQAYKIMASYNNGYELLSSRESANGRSLELVFEEAKNTNVIVVNENHYDPYHRYYLTHWLEKLFEIGYRNLGLEAIASDFNNYINDGSTFVLDPNLIRRGYAVYSPMEGVYLLEPQMAMLLRKAIAIGFNVFGYEEWGKNREFNQARNIKSYMSQNEGKTLILCGYGHISESLKKDTKKRKMASYLKEMLDEDVLTIDQVSFATSSINSILLESSSIIDSDSRLRWDSDLILAHPLNKFDADGKPIWMQSEKTRHTVILDRASLKISPPFFMKLIPCKARIDAIPADITYVASDGDSTKVHLHGDVDECYKILIENFSGERLWYNYTGQY